MYEQQNQIKTEQNTRFSNGMTLPDPTHGSTRHMATLMQMHLNA